MFVFFFFLSLLRILRFITTYLTYFTILYYIIVAIYYIVAGNMNVGAGFSQLETITCAIEIPPMSQYIYDRHHTIVCMVG